MHEISCFCCERQKKPRIEFKIHAFQRYRERIGGTEMEMRDDWKTAVPASSRISKLALLFSKKKGESVYWNQTSGAIFITLYQKQKIVVITVLSMTLIRKLEVKCRKFGTEKVKIAKARGEL